MKGTLVVDGVPILQRQLAAVSPLASEILMVGARSDEGVAPADEPPPGVRSVFDRVAGCGPLGGLDAALAAARHPAVVVLACDMPFVTRPFLSAMIERLANHQAVVPRTDRGYHPLCAVYSRRCQPVVERRLRDRQLALAGLIEEIDVHLIEANELEALGDPDRLLANVNTPDDLRALERLARDKR